MVEPHSRRRAQRRLVRALGQVLSVPLDGHHEVAVLRVHALDGSVGRSFADHQSSAESGHGLVMEGVGLQQLAIEEVMEPTALFDGDQVCGDGSWLLLAMGDTLADDIRKVLVKRPVPSHVQCRIPRQIASTGRPRASATLTSANSSQSSSGLGFPAVSVPALTVALGNQVGASRQIDPAGA